MFRQSCTLFRLLLAGCLLWPSLASAAPVSPLPPAPPELRQRILAIVAEHPRLQAARADLERARARLRAAGKAVYNPELELDTERAASDTSTLQLSQALDLGDQRGARTRVAQADLLQAAAQLDRERQALSRDLLTALAEHTTRQALARLAERGLELMKEFAEIAEKRHRAGDLGLVELDLARLAYSEALMSHATALADAAAARERLRALFLGLPTRLPTLPERLPPARLPESLEAFVRKLPAMRALEAGVAARRAAVALRRAERSWDPIIALRGGKEDQETLIGATLTVPLKVRNPLREEVRAAQQELIRAERLASQTFRDQTARLRSATERYRLLQTAWANWQASGRTSVRRQLELIKRLWQAGDMSTAEYLVQLKQALDTRAAGLELRGRLWAAGFDWLYETASLTAWLDLPPEAPAAQ